MSSNQLPHVYLNLVILYRFGQRMLTNHIKVVLHGSPRCQNSHYLSKCHRGLIQGVGREGHGLPRQTKVPSLT